jgi:hypothetical protein
MLADSAFLNMDVWEAIMPQRQFLACAFAILLSIGAAANAQDPKPYLQMLKYDSQAFQAYATSIKEKTKIIQDVTNGVLTASADLLLKAKVLLTSNSDRVEVEVNTIDGGKNKVNGWSVFYTPYYHDDGAHLKRFDNVSTTTKEFMSAGKFNLWICPL